MALPETLVRSRSAVVFLKEEDTAGTFNGLPDASNAFALTSVPTIAQAGNYTDTSEIGSELITTKKVLNYMDYATFDMEFYAKPSGTAGTAPTEDKLMEWFFGKKSTVASTSVTYSLQNKMTTFTTWSQQFTDESFQLYVGQGCVPTTWGVSLAKDGPVTFSMGVQSNKVLYGGTAEVQSVGADDSGTGSTQLVTLKGPTRYDGATMIASDIAFDGMQVDFLDASASPPYSTIVSGGTDKLVSATSGTAGTLNVPNGVSGAANGDLMVPSLPTADCTSGDAMDQRAVAVYMGKTPEFGTVTFTDATCDTTSGAATIAHDANANIKVGLKVSGTGIPAGAFITTINSATQFTISANATATNSNETLTFVADYSSILDVSGSSSADIFHADNKLNVTAVSVDVDRSLSTPGLTEMTGDEYPAASYVINEPTISGSMTLLLRPKDFQMLSGLRALPVRSLGIEIGSVAGKKIQIAAPAVHMEVPTPGEADGAVQIDVTFIVVKQADCNDEDKFIVRYV